MPLMNTEGFADQTKVNKAFLRSSADRIKKEILSSTPDIRNKTLYYVSPKGDDANLGTDQAHPWKSLEKVNSTPLGLHDMVLFEAGQKWRGILKTQKNVSYSHYGKGDPPIICGSARNYADPELWYETDMPCVYRCGAELQNPGIMAFDHDDRLGNYDACYGSLLFERDNDGLDEKGLQKDLQFFWNAKTGETYLYSEFGNPGKRFRSIEIGESATVVWLNDGCWIDGLRVRYGGALGMACGSVRGVTIVNCVCDWIGGSKLGNNATFGNAIQIYGNAIDCRIEHNWCYQCFDTAMTVQCTGNSKTDAIMENVSMSDNLVEYCYWGIEYWNQPSAEYARAFRNVKIDRNFIRFTGMGWGSAFRAEQYKGFPFLYEQTAALCCFGMLEEAENVSVSENVVELSRNGAIVRMDYYGGERFSYRNNVFVQYWKDKMLLFHKNRHDCDEALEQGLNQYPNFCNNRIWMIEEEGSDYKIKKEICK